ncbi:MAG: Nramp family divalent metal transporter [Candidatus Dormibacteraeota bacterium]|nr:Nramp family divalent metal transporter [Candidatus Dormibacteraeota bacterium]
MTTPIAGPPLPDPILSVVNPDAEPVSELEVGEKHSELAAGGGPPAGRTTIDEAKRKGPIGFLQLLGPGLVTGASDDDPSGIGTYSQVGSQFGYGLLWTAIFTFPLMSAVQELCARIALQTGVGLGASLQRKFPRWLVGAAILGLLAANTFNVGADLGAVAAAGSLLSRGALQALWLVLPVALLIIGLQVFATYATIFKIFKWLTLALFAYVITAFFAHPPLQEVVKASLVPHLEFSKDFVMALVAVLGTTISPYLFFWQASSEVDELAAAGATDPHHGRHGLKRAELHAARVDVLLGMAFSNLVMYFIILTSAAVLHAHGKTDVQTADQAAAALAPLAGPFAFIVFSVGLIGAGLLAIPILTGAATYAIKEFLRLPGSLASKPQHRPTFYLILTLATVAGVVMNFLHLDPIRALFISAVINGVAAPPLLLLIVLLGRDRTIMKGHVSGKLSLTLTGIATAFMAVAAVAMFVTMFAGG